MKKIIQPRIVQVIQQEVAEYYCDRCGKRCGTKENRKETWYGNGQSHYCKKTCSPRDHPSWDRYHIVNCEWCLRDHRDDPRIAEVVLEALGG